MRDSNSARLLVLVCLLLAPLPASACGFIDSSAGLITFRKIAKDSQFVVYGRLKSLDPKGGNNGRWQLSISEVLKTHPVLAGKKVLHVELEQRFTDPQNVTPHLLFGDITKGKISLSAGVPATPAVVGYLKKLLAFDADERVGALRYCFDYLEHADKAIAEDAYREFMTTPDAGICRAAARLSPEKLRPWLQSPKTTGPRLRLYGFLLGCCGKDQDADLLRKLADRLAGQVDSHLIDGILTGYTLLRPKEGRAYARKLLSDTSKSFTIRYSALRVPRFFHLTRPDVLSEDEILDLMRPTLAQTDINDITILYLRQWRCWKACEEVLSAPGQAPITRRAILYYALQCPGPKAAAFVARERARDPEWVEETEELLKLEAEQRSPSK